MKLLSPRDTPPTVFVDSNHWLELVFHELGIQHSGDAVVQNEGVRVINRDGKNRVADTALRFYPHRDYLHAGGRHSRGSQEEVLRDGEVLGITRLL